jgi:hypothetical protein
MKNVRHTVSHGEANTRDLQGGTCNVSEKLEGCVWSGTTARHVTGYSWPIVRSLRIKYMVLPSSEHDMPSPRYSTRSRLTNSALTVFEFCGMCRANLLRLELSRTYL